MDMTIFKKDIAAFVVLICLTLVLSLILGVGAAQAVTVPSSGITVSPANPHSGETSSYTISFQIFSAGATSSVAFTFPSGFNVAGVGPTSAGGTTVTGLTPTAATTTVSGQVVTVTFGGVTATSTTHSVTLTGIGNPSQNGSFSLGFFALGGATDTGSSTAFAIHKPASSAAADTTAPVSMITKPSNGATLTAGQSYTIEGTGSDNASVVTKVEVSVDGGQTWVQAKVSSVGTSYNWSYLWANPTAGEQTIKVRATDVKSNVESPGPSVSVKVQGERPAAEPEKPMTEMTVSELQAKLTELRQTLLGLLQQMIQLLQQQLMSLAR